MIDLADARVLRGVLAGVPLDAPRLQDVVQALAEKDAPALMALTAGTAPEFRQHLQALLGLYGGVEVLAKAAQVLPDRPLIRQALADLAWLADHLKRACTDLQIGFDLSDMSGYAYYSGTRFALYGGDWSDALVRGGRYDEVGAVFGRNRPAVGFSLDLKALAEVARLPGAAPAILAPWGEDADLRAAVRRLREAGEVVVFALPGHAPETQAVACDRELVSVDGRWAVMARDVAAPAL